MKKSKMVVDEHGDKRWYLNEKYHRVDGPAKEYVNGTKEWWINDKCHRVDGPAIERLNGDKIWYLNGKLHRIDGPAIECANGDKAWYLNGKKVKEEDIIDFNPILTEREYINFIINLEEN